MCCSHTGKARPQGRTSEASPRFFYLWLLLAFAFQSTLLADNKLSEKSPFLPPGYGEKEPEPPEPAVQPQGPISREIEFRGIVQIGEVYQFSIFNKKEQKGYWLKQNESQDGISVNSFNEGAATIIVLMNGRSERLTLMSATDSPLPVAKASPPQSQATSSLPAQLNNNSAATSSKRRTVPRRRVILPKKN